MLQVSLTTSSLVANSQDKLTHPARLISAWPFSQESEAHVLKYKSLTVRHAEGR